MAGAVSLAHMTLTLSSSEANVCWSMNGASASFQRGRNAPTVVMPTFCNRIRCSIAGTGCIMVLEMSCCWRSSRGVLWVCCGATLPGIRHAAWLSQKSWAAKKRILKL